MRDRLLMATDVASIDNLPARLGAPRTPLAPTRGPRHHLPEVRPGLLRATHVPSTDTPPPPLGPPRPPPAPPRPAPQVGRATTALILLPGVFVVFFGLNAGGYSPATPAVV